MTPEVAALLALANESVAAAEALLRSGHFRFCVSRAYYAMFYAAEALHLHEGRSYSSHGAVIAAFGRHFVRTNRVDKQFHRHLRKAFEDRQRSDYDAVEPVTRSMAEGAIARAEGFVRIARGLLT